jgi:hypothetical protein
MQGNAVACLSNIRECAGKLCHSIGVQRREAVINHMF